MADSLKIIIDEIRETIKQTFDDKKVSRAQVAQWVIIVGNNLLGKHIDKRSSGAFLTTYLVPVIIAEETTQFVVKGRKHIVLPSAIFDYDRDGGVEYMAYYDNDEKCLPEYRRKTIQRTTPSELQWLENNKHTKPSAKEPYFWRAGDCFNIVGIEAVPVKEIEIGIYQTIDPLEKIDIDKPFTFPQELLEVLKRTVTDLARYSFLFPKDSQNDGTDTATDPQSKNIPKIASVNPQE